MSVVSLGTAVNQHCNVRKGIQTRGKAKLSKFSGVDLQSCVRRKRISVETSGQLGMLVHMVIPKCPPHQFFLWVAQNLHVAFCSEQFGISGAAIPASTCEEVICESGGRDPELSLSPRVLSVPHRTMAVQLAVQMASASWTRFFRRFSVMVQKFPRFAQISIL